MSVNKHQLAEYIARVGGFGLATTGVLEGLLEPPGEGGGTDFSPQIAELQAKDVTQDARLASAESSLLNKASLVSGKVPYEQLPEFPVGRKVNVANRAARLALSSYADLTIAYESSTGDAYGLDANSDPAIDANWSKLGNALGIGVASFNGRTGNIGPQTGDYSSNQISETTDKRFVTSDQINKWDASSSANVVSSFNGRYGPVVAKTADYTADMITETASRKWLSPTQISGWDAKETTTGSQTKATAAQAAAKTYADSTFLPLTQKGAASGVASLDSTGKLAASQVPTFLGQVPRIWREVKGSRAVNVYYRNGNASEQIVFVRHKPTTATTRYTQVVVRLNSASQWFSFSTIQPTVVGAQEGLTVTVPGGWEYAVTTNGGTTDISLIDAWYEMY